MAVKVAGSAGPNVEVETNTLAMRVVVRPDDYGSQGIFSIGMATGTMVAGFGTGTIFSFRYGSTNLALVRKVIVSAGGLAVFTAGLVNFSMFAGRSYTANMTGGTGATLTGNNQKLRTNMATTGVSDIRISTTAALAGGTFTLDAQPLAQLECSTPATAGTPLLYPFPLFESRVGEYPFVCAQFEGFNIQATVPASGTWTAAVIVIWEEMNNYGTALAT